MSTTQRMLPRLVAVDALPNSSVVWGDAEDAALNGGKSYSATIDNASGAACTATLWFRSTPTSEWVANALTVACPDGVATRIDVTGLSGYAARITVGRTGGAGSVTASVLVSQ